MRGTGFLSTPKAPHWKREKGQLDNILRANPWSDFGPQRGIRGRHVSRMVQPCVIQPDEILLGN